MKTGLLIHPEELSKDWIDRISDVGVNTLGLHPRGGPDADKTLSELLDWLKTKEYRNLLDYAVAKGLEISYEMHTCAYLLPRNLFKTHPEYFRMDEDGKRTETNNFCVSNPIAMELFVKNSVALAQALYASGNTYCFWLDDDSTCRCHCPQCEHLSVSDQQLLVMNALVRELRQIIPDAKVPYLAYHACMELPQAVTPEEGIFLEFAPIQRKYQHQAWKELNEEKIRKLLDFFGPQDSQVLEYWYDNSLFSEYKKPEKEFIPNNDLIRKDIMFYEALGFEYISSFACFLGPDYINLYGNPDISAFQKNDLP